MIIGDDVAVVGDKDGDVDKWWHWQIIDTDDESFSNTDIGW